MDVVTHSSMIELATKSDSSSVTTSSRLPTMSERIWKFDWTKVTPWRDDDVSLELSSFDSIAPFMASCSSVLFGEQDERFYKEPMDSAKRRFAAEMDVVRLTKAGATIGYCACHPTDWSTYYCRTVAILPEFRGKGLGSKVLGHLAQALAAHPDVARFEIDVSAGNQVMLRLLSRLEFVPTSTIASERWGLMVHLTKSLRADVREVFGRQFLDVSGHGATRAAR